MPQPLEVWDGGTRICLKHCSFGTAWVFLSTEKRKKETFSDLKKCGQINKFPPRWHKRCSGRRSPKSNLPPSSPSKFYLSHPHFRKFIRGFVFLMTPVPCNVNNPIIEPPTHQRQANPLFKAVTPTPPINTAFIKTQLSITLWASNVANARSRAPEAVAARGGTCHLGWFHIKTFCHASSQLSISNSGKSERGKKCKK